ncbi:MAG: hypothetical protein HW421_3932 [Ignavibacteria bacterium]|nr:hypothetical protein [Ignavibacteria bacterium]
MKTLLTLLIVFLLTSILQAGWKPGDPLIDERDGQSYKTVQIGDQVWMAENLNIGTSITSTKGGSIMSNNSIIEKYCWEDKNENCNGGDGIMKRGGFYEWQEALQFWGGQPQLPVQGLCPKGWHIPSNQEWNTLLSYLGGNMAGSKLLAGGNSGFEALLTGYRCTMTGTYRVSAMNPDTRTYFWTSEQTDAQNAPLIELGASSLNSFSFLKSLGLCVRCIIDNIPNDVQEGSNFQNGFDIQISPNPADDIIKISIINHSSGVQNIQIFIYDVLGNPLSLVFNGKVSTGYKTIEYQKGDLSTGLYFLVIRTKDEIMQKSFVIMK